MSKLLAGIDLGSRFVKIVLYNNQIIDKKIFDTANFYKNFTQLIDGKLSINFFKLGVFPDVICSTGYGRNNVNISNSILINELKAHVFGVFYQLNIENFTLLDIGGQDIKIVKVVDGYIDDFIMNDKCAASTGRYLENMSKLLDVSLDYLCSKTNDPIELNTTCAIFGESEIIGKLAEGLNVDRICSGINYTLAKRIVSMMQAIYNSPLIITGGGALNKALIFFIKSLIGTEEILTPQEPQYNGAIGCINYLKNAEM